MANEKIESYLMVEVENIFDEPSVCENSTQPNTDFTCEEGAWYVTKTCSNCEINICKLLCTECAHSIQHRATRMSGCNCGQAGKWGEFFSFTPRNGKTN